MKHGIRAIGFMVAALAFAGSARAQHSPHYVNGIEGLKASSLPPPGVYWRNYTLFYTADRMRAPDRVKDGDLSLNVFGFVNRAIYITDKKVLGADWGMDIIVPLVNTNFGYRNYHESQFALGDITVEPLVLGWHGDRWDAAFGGGVFLPTGKFDSDRPESAGKGYWTGMATLGGTYYFDCEKTWHASILSRFEFHSKQRSTRMRPGEDFHFEWGVGKTLPNNLTVGAAGYAQWQLRGDKPSGGPRPGHLQRAFAAGPEIAYAVPKWKMDFSIKSIWEFGVRNGAEGGITTLALTKAF